MSVGFAHDVRVTHGCVMPPLRGSGINNASTVGSAHDVRVTHGCVMSPPCGSVLCHRYAVLYYVTATRFTWLFSFSVGSAHDVRVTHGCVMSPLRGSHGCFRFPWVPRTLCASPTAVLCHRHAVLCYVTAMRFIWLFSFSVVFNGRAMRSRCPDKPIPQRRRSQ